MKYALVFLALVSTLCHADEWKDRVIAAVGANLQVISQPINPASVDPIEQQFSKMLGLIDKKLDISAIHFRVGSPTTIAAAGVVAINLEQFKNASDDTVLFTLCHELIHILHRHDKALLGLVATEEELDSESFGSISRETRKHSEQEADLLGAKLAKALKPTLDFNRVFRDLHNNGFVASEQHGSLESRRAAILDSLK